MYENHEIKYIFTIVEITLLIQNYKYKGMYMFLVYFTERKVKNQ